MLSRSPMAPKSDERRKLEDDFFKLSNGRTPNKGLSIPNLRQQVEHLRAGGLHGVRKRPAAATNLEKDVIRKRPAGETTGKGEDSEGKSKDVKKKSKHCGHAASAEADQDGTSSNPDSTNSNAFMCQHCGKTYLLLCPYCQKPIWSSSCCLDESEDKSLDADDKGKLKDAASHCDAPILSSPCCVDEKDKSKGKSKSPMTEVSDSGH